MQSTAVWGWVLRRLTGSAAAWSACVLPFLAFLLLWGLRPVASGEALLAFAVPWLLPTALVGTALGLAILSEGQAFLSRIAPRVRWGGEMGGVGLAALYMQLPILGGSLLCGASLSDLGSSLPAILTADLHLAGCAQLLLLPALSTAKRVTLLLAALWIAPALAAPHDWLQRLLVPLDPGRALRSPESAQLFPALLIAAALCLAGFLLRTAQPGSSRS